MKTIPLIVFVVCFLVGAQLAEWWITVQTFNVRYLVNEMIIALPVRVQAPVDITVEGNAP